MAELLYELDVMMVVNIGVSLTAFGVVIFRVYYLWFRYRMSASSFADNVVGSIDQGNYASAIQTCSQNGQHPLAAMAKDLLLKADKSDREIDRAYDTTTAREIPRFTRLTAFLPQAGNLATLVGLLGTIRGLIIAFGSASGGDAVERQQALAKGITTAFSHTFFGLSIAVFCALTFIVINGRQGILLEGMENALNRIRDRIMDRNKALRAARSGA